MSTCTLTIGGEVQDLAARRIVLDRLTVSWRTGRQLVFTQAVRHDRADFRLEDAVILAADGEVVFRGAVKSVAHVGEPGAEQVVYTADGLRALSRQVAAVDSSGVPKLVWNAERDDEDYDPARTGRTVGQMIQEVLDGHRAALQALGVIEGTGYVLSELEALTAVPSRVVLRERDLDRAVAELVAYQPEYVFQIHPGERRYRFRRVADLPSRTVTVGGDGAVLSNLLVPDLRTRYTAVKVVGEESMTPATVSVSDGGLTPEWDPAREADWTLGKALAPADTDQGTVSAYTENTITDGGKSWSANRWQGGRVVVTDTALGASQTFAVLSSTAETLTLEGTLAIAPDAYVVENGVSPYRYVYSRWRVTDEAKRRMAPLIPGGTWAPVAWTVFQRTYRPVVCEKRHFGGGSGYFYREAVFEYDAGRFLTVTPLARGQLDVPGAAVGPEDVLLIFAYRGARLSARHPESGFAGSAYGEFGLAREKVVYDEQFVSVDEAPRYAALAEALHRGVSDVVYAGRLPLAHLDWSFAHLGCRVNVAGRDRFGNPVTTGWESVNALLGRATFHLAAGTTELDLTTDTSDWSLPFAELRERRRTQDRLRELEAGLRRVRRRLETPRAGAPPDPESLHRGVDAVESLSRLGGEPRRGHLVVQSADGSIAVTNPVAGDGQAFDFALGPHEHAKYIPKAVVEAKGDLIAAAADDLPVRFGPVGDDGDLIVADAAQAVGLKWADPKTVAVTSLRVHDEGPKRRGDWVVTTEGTFIHIEDATQENGDPTVKITLDAPHVFLVDVDSEARPHDPDPIHWVLGLYSGNGVDVYWDGETGTKARFRLTGLIEADWDVGGGPFTVTGLPNADRDTDALPKGQADALYANASHQHDYVTSLAKTGGAPRTGDLTLTEGEHVTITDNGDGSFTIAADLGSGSCEGYLKADGTVPLTAHWNVGGFSIKGLVHGAQAGDAAPIDQVNQCIAAALTQYISKGVVEGKGRLIVGTGGGAVDDLPAPAAVGQYLQKGFVDSETIEWQYFRPPQHASDYEPAEGWGGELWVDTDTWKIKFGPENGVTYETDLHIGGRRPWILDEGGPGLYYWDGQNLTKIPDPPVNEGQQYFLYCDNNGVAWKGLYDGYVLPFPAGGPNPGDSVKWDNGPVWAAPPWW